MFLDRWTDDPADDMEKAPDEFRALYATVAEQIANASGEEERSRLLGILQARASLESLRAERTSKLVAHAQLVISAVAVVIALLALIFG